ncbi:MAG: HAD family hydrolase [Cyanobacteriota bacterium]
MTCSIKCCNTEFNNIEAVLIDVSGTLIDYEELWLKQIGYLSQILAEDHSTIQGELFRTRAMIMKSLGADPETGNIDYTSVLFSSNTGEIKAILSNVLYLNKVNWISAIESVNKTLIKMEKEIDFRNCTRLFPDTVNLLDNLANKTKIIAYSKRSYENSRKILGHHQVDTKIDKLYSMFDFNENGKSYLECSFLSNICEDLNIKPENTVVIADCIYDLSLKENILFKRIIINKIGLDNYFINKYHLKNNLSRLKEIKIN